MSSHYRGDQRWIAFCRCSRQLKPLSQNLKRRDHYFLRFFAKLPVKIRVMRRDPQSADLVTGSPCVTDLVNLALQFTHRTQANDYLRFSGA
jgi:hypothetical protein